MTTEFFNNTAVKQLLWCQCIIPNYVSLNCCNSITYITATPDSDHTWFELKCDTSQHQTRLSASPERTYSLVTTKLSENTFLLSGNTLNNRNTFLSPQ